jgi:hypothetical protein
MATADIDVSQYKKEYNIDCKQAHNFLEEWNYIEHGPGLPSDNHLDLTISEQELIETIIASSKDVADSTDKSCKWCIYGFW